MLLMHGFRGLSSSALARLGEPALLSSFILVAGGFSLAILRQPSAFGAKSSGRLDAYYETLSALDATEWLGIGLLVVVVAWILQPVIGGAVNVWLLPTNETRLLRLFGRMHKKVRGATKAWEESCSTNVVARFKRRISPSIRGSYPDEEEDLRVTLLGNRLAVAQERAAADYDFDVSVLGGSLLAILEEEGKDPTLATRQLITSRMAAATSIGLLTLVSVLVLWSAPATWAYGVPAGLGVVWLLTRFAVSGLIARYEQTLRSVIELHRFRLLEALHLPLPERADEEAARFRDAVRLITRADLEKVEAFVSETARQPVAAKLFEAERFAPRYADPKARV